MTWIDVLVSLFWGVFFGLIMLYANKKQMELYKQDYSDWWTPKRYLIVFIIIVLIVFGFSMFYRSSLV